MKLSINVKKILILAGVAVLFLAIGFLLHGLFSKDKTSNSPSSFDSSVDVPSGSFDEPVSDDPIANGMMNQPITNFEQCVKAGNPVMESYPRQCRSNSQTFIEELSGITPKEDLIKLETPLPNQIISSPLVVGGKARGTWFFEGDFPVILTDWDGLTIATGVAQAQGEWMTEEFVPFEATLVFEKPSYKNNGSLILQKNNPSDLSQNNDALEIPIFFE